jgi:hypothetical protein
MIKPLTPHLSARQKPGYTPSPQKPTVYNGPVVPVAYDPDWQHFKNLTPAQIAWFQAQPEWAAFVAMQPATPFTAVQMNPPIKPVIKL